VTAGCWEDTATEVAAVEGVAVEEAEGVAFEEVVSAMLVGDGLPASGLISGLILRFGAFTGLRADLVGLRFLVLEGGIGVCLTAVVAESAILRAVNGAVDIAR
jgi:hypothetical protein